MTAANWELDGKLNVSGIHKGHLTPWKGMRSHLTAAEGREGGQGRQLCRR